MIERGNPLLELTRESRKMEEKTSRSQEIDTRSFHEEAVKNDRTVQPVTNQGHEQSMLNEVDIDFRIPGSPHSIVKQA